MEGGDRRPFEQPSDPDHKRQRELAKRVFVLAESAGDNVTMSLVDALKEGRIDSSLAVNLGADTSARIFNELCEILGIDDAIGREATLGGKESD